MEGSPGKSLILRGRAPSAVGAVLSLDELTYLRAIAQGVDGLHAGKRFLKLEHGHELVTAHRRIVDRARAIAKRQGDPRWRLVDLQVPRRETRVDAVPSVDDWARREGLDDWAWDELVALHAERFGVGAPDLQEQRRARRNERLMAKRLQLFTELQAASPTARPSDALEGWLAPSLAAQLRARGLVTLADLRERIERGGRWYRFLPAYGPVKGARLAETVHGLIGPSSSALPDVWNLRRAEGALEEVERRALESPPGSIAALSTNRLPTSTAGIRAQTDREAIAAWIVPTARSFVTAASYQKEAERFLLWAALVRGVDLGGVTVEDCTAYKDFLADVPVSWQSRANVPRRSNGWAPFRGPLTPRSQQLAITIVRAWFAWLVQAGYLQRNPWVLVNCRVGDDPTISLDPTSRAFTPEAWKALEAELDDDAKRSPEAAARLRWILTFCKATGLRASELILARRGQLRRSSGIWVLQVFGKGRKAREVVVVKAALEATRDYLWSRGIDFDTCPAETPLLGSLAPAQGRAVVAAGDDQPAAAATSASPEPSRPRGAVGYSALRKGMKRLVTRALDRLPADERRAAERASLHWLRHTFATRAAEAGVLPNDIQEQLGQADPRTAASYSRAQIRHRALALERIPERPGPITAA